MPVAIRKRSWEEHVTHPSGLQYSYDDLDLVCCHGVDGEGPWVGDGASKQGQRTRCASMPEGCHQLPTEDLGQTLEVTAAIGIGNTESEPLTLMENNVKVPLDLKEESVHSPHETVDVDMCQRTLEGEHLPTMHMGNFHCNSNSVMSITNISPATDSSTHSEKANHHEGELDTESAQNHDICSDSNVFKSPHISLGVQQCIFISSNNGLPLSESAGEQPGKLPNHQETKESHTEGYSRPPEIPEATLNLSSAAELEPQIDLLQVEKEKISTSDRADASVTLPAGLLNSSVMESGDVMSLASKIVETVVNLVLDEGRDKVLTDSRSTDSADKVDGLNDLESLNENKGLKEDSRDLQGGMQDYHDCMWALDQANRCEIPNQKLLEQHNFEMTGLTELQREESAQAEKSKKATEVGYGPVTSFDICLKDQSFSQPVGTNLLPEGVDTGYLEAAQENVLECANQCVERMTFLSQSVEDMDKSSMSNELAYCEDQNTVQHSENSSLKLDTIVEISQVEPPDAPLLDLEKNVASEFTQKPAASTGQHTGNLPPHSAEVNDEFLPEELHGNQASGHYFNESPVSEVADGQREHHSPRATVSRMEETDEATHTVIYSETHLVSPVLDATPEDLKEDNGVKVRMRKHEHARLDSMVLLLMKLDQLDQEIENALSATSSMDSTPTLHRRQLLELDLVSVPEALQQLVPTDPSSGPAPALRAKPKSGNSSTLLRYEKEKFEALTGGS